jgi:YbbR domain-containing protein
VQYEPQSVSLELDSRAERSVPVRVEILGEPALGYIKQSTVIEPREVTVSGPTSYVTNVVEAFASLSVQNADADIERELQVRPQDSDGGRVLGVTLKPEEVDVRVPIEPSDYYRPLAVKVVLTGEVASNYRVTDIKVEPPAVTVFGDPGDLAALEGFIETKPINVSGTKESLVVQPSLNVPARAVVVPGQEVEVRVLVEAIQSSLTVKDTPEIQGLGPGLTATISPETVEIILSGPLPVLDALEDNDVRVILELFELSLGAHQVEPQVIAPDGVTAQSIIPTTVQVEITNAPPTPAGKRPITATETITNGQQSDE